MSDAVEQLLARAERLVAKLEAIVPAQSPTVDWTAKAWRWVKQNHAGHLQAIHHPHAITLDDIQFIDHQKQEVARNTQQFLQGLSANHVLLTGARGTGKSSLIKALLSTFSNNDLRLIEVEKQDLVDLPQIVQLTRDRQEKFIVFCDDLTFEANDASLWLSFHGFDQEAYLAIAAHWLGKLGVDFDVAAEKAALDFSRTRGARSGRIAYQFAKDYAGRLRLQP